jgi:hypothetical protein
VAEASGVTPQCVWRVDEDEDGRVALWEAILVERKGSWRYFRHPKTGEAWKERGTHWHPSAEAALRTYVLQNHPPGTDEGRLLDVLFGRDPKAAEEGRWRRLVQVCVLLAKLWARREARREEGHA